MTSEAFEKAYARLNPRQREAVDTIEGPVMVVAGPGTGKTQILTLRIANILKQTDAAPSSILALTFTDAGASAMRKRLLEMIGPEAYKIPIHTFHGFCQRIIDTYPEDFPRIIGSVASTEVDRISIVQELLLSLPLERLRPFGDPLFYTRSALSAMSDLKRENISPERFAEIVSMQQKAFESRDDLHHTKGPHKGKMKGEHEKTQKRLEKNAELARVYAAYEKRIHEKKLYDFDDMILEVVRAFETNEDLLLRVQEEYQYVLADEHQDANPAQNKLLELLSNFHENPNLFVVGDEKQAIYRFQGASAENFASFARQYPSSKIIHLEENYRSSQSILDRAHALISHAGTHTALLSRSGHADLRVRLVECATPDAEYALVAKTLLRKREALTPLEECAVLYRNNSDAFALARVLEKNGIPYRVESDRSILDAREIQKLVLLLRAVAEYGSAELLAQVLPFDFLGFEPLEVYELLAKASREKIKLYELLAKEERFATFAQKLARWATLGKNEGIVFVLETIVSESGFLAHILSAEGSIEKLEHLGGFFREVEALAESNPNGDLSTLIAHIAILEEHAITLKKREISHPRGAVRLMTAHRSKGLEFDFVYIIGAYDGHWGGRRSREQFHLPLAGADEEESDEADERRLFYVALTRARKEVTVSLPRVSDTGKELLPSRFIAELGAEALERIEPALEDVTLAPEVRFGPSKALLPSVTEREFLLARFAEQPLSATGLNNYLACPWRFFYENLLRIPKAQHKSAQYGTAVHGALHVFFDTLREGKELSGEALVDLFEKYLNALPMRDADYTELLSKGKEALSAYYKTYRGAFKKETLNEFAVPAVELPNGMRLVGKIDKIELGGVGEGVVVVDYKSGKQKSRNEILGLTKGATGDNIRQLRFYKLLLELHDPSRFSVRGGMIDFIEPDEKGRLRREYFDIGSSDTELLLSEIEKMRDEFTSFRFWNSECGDKKCRYCFLRSTLKDSTSPTSS